jgi:hypothetical protein
MPAAGGLKLRVESAQQQDRRERFAQVRLSAADDPEPIVLVTDARGRMRYRLADGDYEVSLVEGDVVPFSVRDHRWTTVRLLLT